MEVPQTGVPDLFDAAGVIIVDVACRRCGYNLRGLRAEGRCPECGTPIGLSTHGDLLRFADPAWVDTMLRGVTLMLWGILVSFVVSILANCLGSAAGMRQEVSQAVSLLGGLLGVYGAWLLTTPDPSRIGEDRYVTARKLVRFGLIGGVLGGALQIAIKAIPALPVAGRVALGVPAVLLGLAGVVGEFAKFLYIERIANRVPDPKMAGLARFLRWAYSICLLVLVVAGGLVVIVATSRAGGMAALAAAATAPASGPAGRSATLPAVGGAVLGCACVFGLGMLVFTVLAIGLYFSLRRALRTQAEMARQTWAAAGEAGPGSPGSAQNEG